GVGVSPDHLAGGGVTCDGRCAVLGGVLVEARRSGGVAAVVGVPRRAVGGAVVEEVRLRVVGEVAPRGAAAELPGVAVPAVYAGVGNLVGRVVGRPALADAHVFVRAGAVVLPELFTGLKVVGGDPTADAALAAFVADEDVVANDEGGV